MFFPLYMLQLCICVRRINRLTLFRKQYEQDMKWRGQLWMKYFYKLRKKWQMRSAAYVGMYLEKHQYTERRLMAIYVNCGGTPKGIEYFRANPNCICSNWVICWETSDWRHVLYIKPIGRHIIYKVLRLDMAWCFANVICFSRFYWNSYQCVTNESKFHYLLW